MTPQISPAAGCCPMKDHPEGGNNHAGGARLQQEPTESAAVPFGHTIPLGNDVPFGSSGCRAGTRRRGQKSTQGEPVSAEFVASKELLASDTSLIFRDVLLFCRHGSGVTLRAYQQEVALAVIDAVMNRKGLAQVVMFPRLVVVEHSANAAGTGEIVPVMVNSASAVMSCVGYDAVNIYITTANNATNGVVFSTRRASAGGYLRIQAWR